MAYHLYTTVCRGISVIYHSMVLLISTTGVVYIYMHMCDVASLLPDISYTVSLLKEKVSINYKVPGTVLR